MRRFRALAPFPSSRIITVTSSVYAPRATYRSSRNRRGRAQPTTLEQRAPARRPQASGASDSTARSGNTNRSRKDCIIVVILSRRRSPPLQYKPPMGLAKHSRTHPSSSLIAQPPCPVQRPQDTRCGNLAMSGESWLKAVAAV
ncbi:uncharacterized protein B0H18DRAFT_30581 [Fomitopsis serialis]|uniref:uncharacterized protein n=1 Tax=Fomitopsis serialis TaxID=139415 RepID=UPI002008DECD|nr:uncharacterized protein B0H18DRAFT_30581 [Neoantrodia serialis]KAH9932571.1 hypothetical protein B0H18DRAFT_30581 [Neoantrodia serialis]